MAEVVKNVTATDTAGAIIRHGLTALGLLLASTDVIDDSQVDTIIGAGSILFGLGLSLFNKRDKNQKIEEALHTPPPQPPIR